MYSLVDPSFIFISQIDWDDLAKRDEFLLHLLDHLKVTDGFKITNILWSDEIEEAIWDDPPVLPWRVDRDWNIRLLPVVSRLFKRNRIICACDSVDEYCSTTPPLDNVGLKPVVLSRFSKLFHKINIEKNKVYFCLGLKNISNSNLMLKCSCHQELEVQCIGDVGGWLNYYDFNDDEIAKELFTDREKASLLMDLIARVSFGKSTIDFKKGYSFSEKFQRKFLDLKSGRKHILNALVHRLLLTQKEATNTHSLHDEPVKGKKILVRRFRTSGECRVHYEYSRGGSLKFLNYYGEGEHNDDLP